MEIIEGHPLAGFRLRKVEVFEQYTGLNDDNSKDIYEGDIIDASFYGKMHIRFIDGYFEAYDPKGRRFPNSLINIIEDCKEYEDDYVKVIGNVRENPELLKS
jgi:uncharacterized phage protein (TIGR01671 family)